MERRERLTMKIVATINFNADSWEPVVKIIDLSNGDMISPL